MLLRRLSPVSISNAGEQMLYDIDDGRLFLGRRWRRSRRTRSDRLAGLQAGYLGRRLSDRETGVLSEKTQPRDLQAYARSIKTGSAMAPRYFGCFVFSRNGMCPMLNSNAEGGAAPAAFARLATPYAVRTGPTLSGE
jgi:hypothetical protein